MPAFTVPSSARVPVAITAGVLALTVPLSLGRGGADPARAGVSATVRADVRAAQEGTVGLAGPGPLADEQVAATAAPRGSRHAAPPLPSGRLAEEGRALLDALGIGHAEPINNGDLQKAANTLGVRTGGWVREEHLDAMQHAYLQRAKPAVVGLDVPVADEVTEDAVKQAAATVGLDVGDKVDPTDVQAVLTKAADHRGGPTPRIAVVAGVNVRMPSRVPIMAGFHQASYGNAIGMHTLEHPANALLPTRARGTSRTSAVDVRVPPDTTVLAPIRGTVVEVTPYALYGKYADYKIRMVPESDPGLLVSILHVSDPLVSVGQTLEAGDPLAARATQFPFESQIDRFTSRGPHVHVEARRR